MAKWTDIVSCVSSGVSALSNLGTGIAGAITARKNFKEELAQREQFFNQNMQNTWDMWNATNEYNSPANQAALMKQAGLNPDLQSVNFQGASASSMPDAMSQFQPRINTPQQIGSVITSTLQYGFDYVNKMFSLENQSLQNDILSAEAQSAYDKIAEQIASGSMTKDLLAELVKEREFLTDDEKKANTDMNPDNNVSKLISEMHIPDDLLRNAYPGFSRSQRRALKEAVNRIYRSPQFQEKIMRSFNEQGKMITEENQRQSDPKTQGQTYGVPTETMSIFMNAVWEAWQKTTEAGNATSDYNKEYYGALDPKKAADVVNFEADIKGQQKELGSQMMTFLGNLHDILSREIANLEKGGLGDHWSVKFMKGALQFMEIYAMMQAAKSFAN